MHRKLSFLVAAAMVGAALPAGAQTEPPPTSCLRGDAVRTASVIVVLNGECLSFSELIQIEGKISTLPRQDVQLPGGASFYVSAIMNADPFALFTFGDILPNGFGPLSFDVYFSTPVVGGPYNHASSSGTLGVTASSIPASVGTVSAGSYPFYLSGLGDATNLGVDTGTGACVAASGSSGPCDPPPASAFFAPFTPALLTAHLSYTHTSAGAVGGSSSAGWTGVVNLDVSAVPEPATVSLVVTGVLVLGAVARRRRA